MNGKIVHPRLGGTISRDISEKSTWGTREEKGTKTILMVLRSEVMLEKLVVFRADWKMMSLPVTYICFDRRCGMSYEMCIS